MKVTKARRHAMRAIRHGARNLARWRPTPVVGALLLGAVLGVGATGAIAAVSGPDDLRGDRGVITQHFQPGPNQEHPGHGPGGDHPD